MTQQAEVMNKIGNIPPQYLSEVIDFIGYLQFKAQQNISTDEITSQSKMNIPVNSEGKFMLNKKVLAEMEKNSPNTRALSGILSKLKDADLDDIRYKALAEKHLK